MRKKRQKTKFPTYWEETTRPSRHYNFPRSPSRENKKFITCHLGGTFPLSLSLSPPLPPSSSLKLSLHSTSSSECFNINKTRALLLAVHLAFGFFLMELNTNLVTGHTRPPAVHLTLELFLAEWDENLSGNTGYSFTNIFSWQCKYRWEEKHLQHFYILPKPTEIDQEGWQGKNNNNNNVYFCQWKTMIFQLQKFPRASSNPAINFPATITRWKVCSFLKYILTAWKEAEPGT